MAPTEYFTDVEMQELIYKVGDLILDIVVDKDGKQVPPKYETGILMLKTAHSFLADYFVPSISE